jgi:hypothetical protein
MCGDLSFVMPKNQCQFNRGRVVPKVIYDYLDAIAGDPFANPVCEALPCTDINPGPLLSPNSAIVSRESGGGSTGMR